MFLIKEMPKNERPRERLINYGAKALSNVELIAILLRTGHKDKSVIELAKQITYKYPEIYKLTNVTYQELLKIPGIKQAKATTILAAIELGRRLNQKIDYPEEHQLLTCYDIYEYMKEIANFEQEHFYCLYLNTRLAVIKKEAVFIGTNNEIIIHPREIFKKALQYSATYVAFVHNHPTGKANPSNADDNTTRLLVEAANFLQIKMVDHIIIGKGQFYSYKEQRIFKL